MVRTSKRVLLLVLPIMALLGVVVLLSIPRTKALDPVVAWNFLSRFNLTIPEGSRVEQGAEWVYKTPLEMSATKYTFFKIELPPDSFRRTLASIKESGAVFVSANLSTHPNANIPWWNNMKYGTCYYTEILDTNASGVMHIYLITDATNAFVMLEHILVKSL